MVNILLVHGTTQAAEGFDPLIAALEARGHRSFAVRVPDGLGSAEEYATVLSAQVPSDLEAPVAVAHSASGLLLPALARQVGARHQVWLAAAVADYAGRRSLLVEIQQDPLAVFNPEWLGIDPTADPVLATHFLFHDADLGALRTALPTVEPCDLSRVYSEVPVLDPAGLPSTYVLPTDDRTLSPQWMARIARERLGVEPLEFSGGHSPYVAAPGSVAEIIINAATAGNV